MQTQSRLTIGRVVKLLQESYPELSLSKVRYLEDEGLVSPTRTAGGYRTYSKEDVKQLEQVLYLQKNRFLPLAVIKQIIERGELEEAIRIESADDDDAPGISASAFEDELVDKLHPLERIPELLGVSITFVRQLSEAGVISFKRSPAGRDLVDGHDFEIIRAADQLSRHGVGPKHLRQYVTTANRESAMFEQALAPYAGRGEVGAEQRKAFSEAFDSMLKNTALIHDSLVRRSVGDRFKNM